MQAAVKLNIKSIKNKLTPHSAATKLHPANYNPAQFGNRIMR